MANNCNQETNEIGQKERASEMVSRNLDVRDKWMGIRMLRKGYNPIPYTLKDEQGNRIKVGNKAAEAATTSRHKNLGTNYNNNRQRSNKTNRKHGDTKNNKSTHMERNKRTPKKNYQRGPAYVYGGHTHARTGTNNYNTKATQSLRTRRDTN